MKLNVNCDATPKFFKVHTVPLALKEKVEADLENLESMGILSREAIKPGTERNGMEPEVIDAQYGRGHWTRGQKLALIKGTDLSSILHHSTEST